MSDENFIQRDLRIREMEQAGFSAAQIAAAYGLTKTRVRQILQRKTVVDRVSGERGGQRRAQ